MKKVLSFVLVLAMILGSFATAFAGAVVSTTIEKDNTVVPFKDAGDNGKATVLRDLGALKGYTNGTVGLDGTLTRAEAATIVVRLLGLDELGAVNATTKFSDVKKDIWYSGYVKVAADQGIIQGIGGTKFAPEAEITVDQCVALVCQTLGYNAAHLAGTWPVNYRNVARSLGLLEDVTVGSVAATREDLVNLVYAALDKNKVTWMTKETGYYAGTGDDVYAYSFANESLFESVTGLATTTGAIYKVSEEPDVVDASTVFANGFDASAFFGKKVYFLSKVNKKGANEAKIGIWKADSTTLVGKFTPNRTTPTNFEKFVTVDGKEYKFNITPGAATVLTSLTDNVYKNGATDASVTLNKNITYEISATLSADKKYITTVSSISYWKANKVVVVNESAAALLADEDIIALNNKGYLVTENFKTTNASVTSTKKVYLEGSCVVEGDATTFADIQEDDVVEVFLNRSNEIVKLVVTRNKVVGKVDKVSGLDITLGGKTYKEGALTTSAIETTFNKTSEYAIYLDSQGKYVATKENKAKKAASEWTYAFLNDVRQRVDFQDDETGNYYKKVVITVPEDGKTATYDTLKVATDGTFDFDAKAKLDNATTAGMLVKVQLKDGKLSKYASAGATAVSNAAASIKVNSNGIVYGKLVTDDTKIYKVASTGNLNLASNYKVLTFADIKDRVFSGNALEWVVNAKNEVEVLVVKAAAGTQTGETSYVTGAALIAKDDIADDDDLYAVTFKTTGSNEDLRIANATDVGKVCAASIWALTLEDDIIVAQVEITPELTLDDKRASVEALTLDGRYLTFDDETNVFVDDDVQTWFYDYANASKGYQVIGFYEAIGNKYATDLALLDLDADSDIDIILVYAPK